VIEPKRAELTEERQELVAKTYQQRNSTRSTGRIFGVSHVTVQNWLKKSPLLEPVQSDYQGRKTTGHPGS
jgi:DNA invertase Pin-like site-specific DNA recombinase